MGDNTDGKSRQIQRDLVLTRASVIHIKHPKDTRVKNQSIETIVAKVFDPKDETDEYASEWADTNRYLIDDIPAGEADYVIGWTQYQSWKTLLFKQNRNLFTTGKGVEVFTDSIFPVITDALNPYPFKTEMASNFIICDGIECYEPSIQLILMDANVDKRYYIPKALVSCQMPDESGSHRQLIPYRADLRLFTFNPKTDINSDTKMLRSQAVVRLILDKQDRDCQLVGLYAGTERHPKPFRQLWPIHRPGVRQIPDLSFRHSDHRKKFFRRIGYLVSKQALLCVCERKQSLLIREPIGPQEFCTKDDSYYYTSLLKDHTFVIADSNHIYIRNTTFNEEMFSFAPYMMPLSPKILVLPEGLNALMVENDYGGPHLKTVLLSQDLVIKLDQVLSLDWYQFQRDFDVFGGQQIDRYLKPTMCLDDINDYMCFNISDIETSVCFSLFRTYSELNRSYTESYHVFIEVPSHPDWAASDRRFDYIMSCNMTWFDADIQEGPKRLYRYNRWYKTNDLSVIEPKECAKHIMDSIEEDMPYFALHLASTPALQFNNYSPISLSRDRYISFINMKFIAY